MAENSENAAGIPKAKLTCWYRVLNMRNMLERVRISLSLMSTPQLADLKVSLLFFFFFKESNLHLQKSSDLFTVVHLLALSHFYNARHSIVFGFFRLLFIATVACVMRGYMRPPLSAILTSASKYS